MTAAATAPRPAGDLDEYPFESHRLDLDGGVQLAYVDEGPRDGDPLLFVHGNPSWSYLWRKPIAAFAGSHRCVAVDHVGCGRSDKPQDYAYRLAQHVENLERLILALDLKRVTLVVHDWGGPIGLGAMLRHPERLARCIITNTAGFTNDSWGGRAPWRIRVCRTPLLGELAVRGANAFAGMATLMAVERAMPPEVKRGFLAPYDSWQNRIATIRFVQDIPLTTEHPSYATLLEIERGLERLRGVPTCIVWGERDWCFTPAFRGEWQRRLPGAEVHPIPDAGHYLLEDAGDEVVATMRGFLERNPLP
jgi:haloalkane dehalogenase